MTVEEKVIRIKLSSQGDNYGVAQALTLKDDWSKKEFDEGCNDANNDFNTGKSMPNNLNFPESPYARGYYETYIVISRK